MKNNIMKFLSVVLFILGPVIAALAQPLPGSGAYYNDPSLNGLPGAGAPTLSCPIGNGYLILLVLAFSYGIYKTWQMHKAEKTA